MDQPLLGGGQSPQLLSFMNQPRGPLSEQAYQLANAPRLKPTGASDLSPFASALGATGDSSGPPKGVFSSGGILGGEDNQKFKSAGQGALMGSKFGWAGALVGGLLGYGAAGGVKDANPIDASGFSGTTMDEAWKNQNLARLGSNPGGAVFSKINSAIGIKPDSTTGKIFNAGIDPTATLGGLFRGGHGDEKRNWKAFDAAFPGTTVTDSGDYKLADGTIVNQKQLDSLAGTWYGAAFHPDGDQAGWQAKLNDVLTGIYGSNIPDFGTGG